MSIENPVKPGLPSTSRSLPIALIRAREGIMPPIRAMLAESGITEQQWRVLRALEEYGPQNASNMAYRAGLLLPSLTRIAQKMQDNGLITLTRDELDKRRQTIAITALGQSIIDNNSEQAAQIVEGFKQTLGKDKYEQLLDLLALLENPEKRKY